MVRTLLLTLLLASAPAAAQDEATSGDVTAAARMSPAEREEYVNETIDEMEAAVEELVELLVEARLTAEDENDEDLQCVTMSLFVVRGLLDQVREATSDSESLQMSNLEADGPFRRVVVARLAAMERLIKARDCMSRGAVSGGETRVRWSSTGDWSTLDGESDSALDVTQFGGDSPGASPFS
jgi:hypothetical protein